MRVSRLLPRSLSLLFLVLMAGACHSWRSQSSPAPQVVASMNGRGTVRLLRSDQSVMVLSSPQVVGDSIVGTTGNPPQRAAVAIADVRRIDTRRVNAAKTGGLAVGTIVLVSVVVVAAAVAAVLGNWN
ncbi:MAG TPA: hypothetical protein VFJ16_00335 [Longimicrobium sp.]|nr:hypothetical protein [Longimicrobium sp.]